MSYLVTAAAATFYTGKDFYEQATDGPLQKDLAVDLVSLFPYPLRSPCCGQNMTYVVSARNSGTLGLAGVSVVLNFPPTQTPTVPLATALTGFPAAWVVDALNSYPTVPGQVTWKRATAWGAKASQNFTCTVTLPASPCAGPLSATATIKPIASDVHLADNSSTLNQQITCSHDPNDMQVSPAGCGPQGFVPAGQPLTYLIRFQNTGNGPAYQVVVSNKLSANLDVSTLQVLGSSHPNAVQIQGNQLVFNFPNIYLPAQSDDDLGSQGYVKYQVLPLGAAPVGALIANNAAIYFDRNAPVLTVTTTNTLTADPLPVATFSLVQRIGSTGHTNDFTYTGGTAGATYLWSFGPDATPSTSTAQNPTGVVFATDGDKLVGLQVSLGSCQTEPAVQIVHVGVPSLTTDMVDGQLVLSWQGSGYHLQERTGLQPGTPWSATSATVTQVESSYAATPVMDSATKFYRLSQVAP